MHVTNALRLDRKVPAATLFGTQLYVLEQQGFRKVVDTTFIIGFLFTADADLKDVERYFNALQQSQREIARDPGLYKHYYLRELPERIYSVAAAASLTFRHGDISIPWCDPTLLNSN